jgi:iron complex transport system ATP-binding protein
MLTASAVRFGYDPRVPVLRGFSIEIGPDALTGILGPNGSGKTTALRLLAGTRQPQGGSVTLDGVPVARLPRHVIARRMAVVPQETHLAFDYTVAEVAMMGRYPHLGAFEIEGPADEAIVGEALAATGTLHLAAREFATLSGGEKQRVVIASALAQLHAGHHSRATHDTHPAHPGSPGILLLDEPTASLDLKYQLEITLLLEALHRDRGVSIVISTHDLNLAARLCRRLVLMRDGAVLASGPVADVLTPDNIRRTYDVEARILEPSPGRRLVVPVQP